MGIVLPRVDEVVGKGWSGYRTTTTTKHMPKWWLLASQWWWPKSPPLTTVGRTLSVAAVMVTFTHTYFIFGKQAEETKFYSVSSTVEPPIMDTLKSGQPPYNGHTVHPLPIYCPYISISEEGTTSIKYSSPNLSITRRFHCI